MASVTRAALPNVAVYVIVFTVSFGLTMLMAVRAAESHEVTASVTLPATVPFISMRTGVYREQRGMIES